MVSFSFFLCYVICFHLSPVSPILRVLLLSFFLLKYILRNVSFVFITSSKNISPFYFSFALVLFCFRIFSSTLNIYAGCVVIFVGFSCNISFLFLNIVFFLFLTVCYVFFCYGWLSLDNKCTSLWLFMLCVI